MDAATAGRRLATQHGESAVAVRTESLVNYAERTRIGDWSLRSALVRLAQPEPVRSGAVLKLVRRCDAALHPLIGALERNSVLCDRYITLATAGTPTASYPDTRAADLARLRLRSPEAFDSLFAAYSETLRLTDDELTGLDLLGVAAELDALADTLTMWAVAGSKDPPVDAVDARCSTAFTQLEVLGVARESGPPRRRGS